MYHYPFVSLEEGKGSIAFYNRKEPKILIVFVHGFNGKAVETWTKFNPLLLKEPDFGTTDLLFYGYDSIKGQAYDQSLEFFHFLKQHFHPNTGKIFRSKNLVYEKIIVVAHSLGSIVSRYAFLTAIDQGENWASKLELVLFAPAHNGARLQKLLVEDLPIMKLFGIIAAFAKPIIQDLNENSNCVKVLKERIESYRGTLHQKTLTARTVVAHEDLVVNNGPYCYDIVLPESPIREKSHIEICKPNDPKYLTPINIIKQRI